MNGVLATRRDEALRWWRALPESEQRRLAQKYKSWWDFSAVTRSTSTIAQIYHEEHQQ